MMDINSNQPRFELITITRYFWRSNKSFSAVWRGIKTVALFLFYIIFSIDQFHPNLIDVILCTRIAYLFKSIVLYSYLHYLSNEIATNVKTEVETVTFAIKLFMVQYMEPNGQSEFSIKMKLKTQFNEDINKSAILKLSKK